MIDLPAPSALARRMGAILSAVAMLSLFAVQPVGAETTDDRDQVTVAGVCGGGATSRLSLKDDGDRIELRFKVGNSRPGAAWRVVLVQERRVAWKGTTKTRPSGSFEVRRELRDLPGSDAITARAWGPQGLVCRAAASLSDS